MNSSLDLGHLIPRNFENDITYNHHSVSKFNPLRINNSIQFKNFQLAHLGHDFRVLNARVTTFLTNKTHLNPFLGKETNFLVKLSNLLPKTRTFE